MPTAAQFFSYHPRLPKDSSMKNKLLVTSLLVGAALITSCKPAPEEPAVQASATTAQQLDKAQVAVKDAAQDLQNYAFEQKAEFVTKMEAQLAELNRSLDELSAKIEKSTDAIKADARPKLAALRDQAAELKKQLAAVKDATATTWDKVKADAQKAYTALKDGFADARQWVSDKIAP
jgi:paraquat-inducible protein B